MTTLTIRPELLKGGLRIESKEDGDVFVFPENGGCMELPELPGARERFLVFRLHLLEAHSGAFELRFFGRRRGNECSVRFGVLPDADTLICIDMNWLSASQLFPGSTPGELKVVCHGERVLPEELVRAELCSLPCFHEQHVRLSGMRMQDERPEHYPLPDRKLVDRFGQNAEKLWPGKIRSEEELKTALLSRPNSAAPAGWDRWGGWKDLPVSEPRGFFHAVKRDGRWWVADPDGNAFFSLGCDCMTVGAECRVDGLESLLEWLPERNDPEWKEYFETHRRMGDGDPRETPTLFSYLGANLRRAMGENWREGWASYLTRALWNSGFNTIGNWSDLDLLCGHGMPYVTSLPKFPDTQHRIFRDFPDVFAAEYRENAEKNAQALAARRDDPYLIGYFLRNEPSWAFVDSLVLADEVLNTAEPSVCRTQLISFLRDRYTTARALSEAWQHEFESFDDLMRPVRDASRFSERAKQDMHEFSRQMIRAYVEIPAKACRAVDPNHMILGMRWAWVKNPDLVTGWENFDVFSLNCYSVDPTAAIENVERLGVDLPVTIGEFHFGALDRGPTATGLEGVQTQSERAKAFRYYCERVAAHPCGVGCHFFQCYDQFVLGRFDGENYNIGLFDICSRPYPEMFDAALTAMERTPALMRGETLPTEERPRSIPMIAY